MYVRYFWVSWCSRKATLARSWDGGSLTFCGISCPLTIQRFHHVTGRCKPVIILNSGFSSTFIRWNFLAKKGFLSSTRASWLPETQPLGTLRNTFLWDGGPGVELGHFSSAAASWAQGISVLCDVPPCFETIAISKPRNFTLTFLSTEFYFHFKHISVLRCESLAF